MSRERSRKLGAAPTGEVRQNADLTFSTVVRTWEKRETFRLPMCTTKPEADARSTLLATVAKRFRVANVNRGRGDECLTILATASPKALEAAIAVCEELLGGKIPIEGRKEAPTFKAIGKEWIDGDLRKRFPDEIVEVKDRTNDVNKGRFDRYIYPHIGDRPINQITREQCDEIKRALPEDLSKETRRQVCLLVNRVFNLAELAGHIERNPLPRGWTPKAKGKSNRKKYAVLYRDEDRAILACPEVPLVNRLLYGFLAREGMRKSEAIGLRWGDVDAKHRTVRLDENKTDNARPWELAPGVAEALDAWRALSGDVTATDYVFAENRIPIDADHLADDVREHLLAAKVDRHALHEEGKNWGRFGTHSFRRSFVTRAYAVGQNDAWIRRRGGWTSDEIRRYEQDAEELRRIDPGDWDALVFYVPEFTPIPAFEALLRKLSEGAILPLSRHSEPNPSRRRRTRRERFQELAGKAEARTDWGSEGRWFESSRPDHCWPTSGQLWSPPSLPPGAFTLCDTSESKRGAAVGSSPEPVSSRLPRRSRSAGATRNDGLRWGAQPCRGSTTVDVECDAERSRRRHVHANVAEPSLCWRKKHRWAASVRHAARRT